MNVYMQVEEVVCLHPHAISNTETVSLPAHAIPRAKERWADDCHPQQQVRIGTWPELIKITLPSH